jgi:anti-sigma B factor antagonist
MGLEVATARRDDLVVVTLAGELDIYTVPLFRREVAELDPAEFALVIDMTDVTLIDSSGLGALVTLRNRAADGDRVIGIASDSPPVLRVFDVTGLRTAFAIAPDAPAAAAAIGTTPTTEA